MLMLWRSWPISPPHASGAGGELLALDQHDVAPTELRQVIGNGTTDDAAADDDDAGAVGRSTAMKLNPHPRIVGIESRAGSTVARRASPWSSMSKVLPAASKAGSTEAKTRLFFTRCP